MAVHITVILLVHCSLCCAISIAYIHVSFILKLQQVMDSFIIFAGQQQMDNLEIEELSSSSPNSTLLDTRISSFWTQFSPSNIRLVPFPTPEYTDDEFQSIVKRVMGVLYVPCGHFFFPWHTLSAFYVIRCDLESSSSFHGLVLS